ncbi:ABC transporter permease (plasmid) [Thioclava sp. 'Guangxiensis']|uniref:putative B6 ABC transporter permease subunit 2 n=1 Tax=Thioclava sp. 'Guangxiensis' TaxID=3149044 RepID=UPI0032C44D69
MSDTTDIPEKSARPKQWRASPLLMVLGQTLVPIILALVAAGLVLAMLGSDPLAYYGYVVERGLLKARGLQATLEHMIPLLILGAALIVSFRSGLWNLGIDGQYLLGTLTAGALGPVLLGAMPMLPALMLTVLAGAVVGGLWALPPAWLRARYGTNEVISGLMMSLIATSLSSALIKLWLKDPNSLEPQTLTIPVDSRLPSLGGTDIDIGLILALGVVLGVHLMMTRTALGLRFRILGLNPKAALHAGFGGPLLAMSVLCLSGALGGLAGAVELSGALGKMQASWNPAYGFAVVPLVFLARFNGFALILFVFAYSVLEIGGASAATRMNVPQDFTLVLVAFVLVFLALAELLTQKRKGQ